MKRKLLFAIVALLCSVGAWAQVAPTASTPEVGNNYYLYNPTTGLFLCSSVELPFVRPIGDAWKLEAAAGHEGWITLRLTSVTTDGCGYFWGKWWANDPAASSSSYSDERIYQLVNTSGSNYKLQSYAWNTDSKISYIYINKGNEGDRSYRIACNSHEQNGLDEGYTIWQFISEEDYAAYMAYDKTSLITNNDFTNGLTGWTVADTEGNKQAHGNTAVEYWREHAADGSFDYYQNLTDLQNGKYALRAAMYNSTNGETDASFNSDGQCGVYGNSSFAPVTTDGTAYNIYTTDEFFVLDGNLRLGVKSNDIMTARWFGVDWIQLKYYGNAVSLYSHTLFDGDEAITDNTWYAFTVSTAGYYRISSSADATLYYTQNASNDADATDSKAFTAGGYAFMELSEGTFYFKSSAASTIKIEAVGSGVLQNGDVVTDVFITNPSFETGNTEGWSQSKGNLIARTPGTNYLSNTVGSYCAGRQQISTTESIYQKFSGLVTGKYVLSVNAYVTGMDGNASFYAGGNSLILPQGLAASTYTIALDESVNGGNFGLSGKGAGDRCRFYFDNFTLTYYNTLPDVSGVNALLAEPMAGDVRAALDAANTAYTGDKTVANYNALQTAIVNAKVSIAEFAVNTGADADWTGVIQNPSFETGNTTGWTYTSSNDHGAKANDNATYTMSDVDGSYLFNIWATGNTISQTLKNLPAGSYKLTAVMGTDAGATFRLKMGDETGYATSVNKGTGVTVTVYAKLTAKGDLTISADAGGSMWYKVDNFQLTYSPTLPASLTAVEGKMNSSVESTQTSTVAAYNATSGQTIDNMIAAQAAIYAAHQSVQVYNSIATIKDGYDTKADALDATGQAAYATATGTASTGAETKYTEGTYTTAAEAETAYRRDYVAAVKAQDTDNADMTDVIVNPSFETKDNTGWSWSADSGNSNWDDASKFTSGSLADGGGLWFRDFWAQGANGKVYQTINLPAGSYELSVYTKTSEGTSINLKAGSETTTTTAENGEAFKMEVEFTLASQQNVEISIGSAAAGAWYNIDDFRLTLLASYYANAADYAALSGAISTASTTYSNHLGFEEGEYAPYNNIDALTALATAQAIDPKESNTKASVQTVTSALTGATWTDNDGDVECVYNGDFAIGQGSPAADIQNYGWSRTNGWGQFRNDVYGSTTGYYNQPGSLQYGNVGEYTMPLKANTIYRLQFKYGSWDHLTTPTISVLNATDGMAAQSFASTNTNYKNALTSVDMLFATGAAGNYILTLAGSDNIVFTGVSITKASSQTLTLPSATEYAAGTYPAVELDGRTFSDADRWYTLCVPFEFDKSLFSEVKELTGITVNGDNVSMTFGDAASTTTAGQPYLVKSSNSTITFEDVALDPSTTADNTSATADGYTVNYVGTFSNVALTSSNTDAWVVSNNMLYNVDSDVTVGVYRAYFTVTAPTPSPIKSLTIDGDATSVNAIDNGQLTMDNAAIYNLAGQKVKKATKGIYIINGKKTLVK